MSRLVFFWRIIHVQLNLDLATTLVVSKMRVFFYVFVCVPVFHGGHAANVLEEMPGEYIV
jgi:hypothetical protein